MSSHDDPEARIRELERSLADRTSELTQASVDVGSQEFGTAPPTTPPAYYGAPFPPVPMRTTRGIGRWWLVLGVLTMLTVGVVAATVVYWSNMFSDVTSFIEPFEDRPTVSGGGPFGEEPTRTGANRTPVVPSSEPSISSVPPGGNVSVSGVGEEETFECNDGVVTISGVSNTVVIIGHCLSISVSGVENVVTVDAVDTIGASGFDNRVTFRIGEPEIQNAGTGNVVERG